MIEVGGRVRPELSGIQIFPVKSCRGISLRRAVVERAGLRHDREWMIVDAQRQFVSQRQDARLAGITVSLEPEALVLERRGETSLRVPIEEGAGEALEVEIWGRKCEALDQGERASRWLSEWLGQGVRLVRLPPARALSVESSFFSGHAETRFSDGFPFLLLSEGSLEGLNARLARPVSMERFRPNLIIRGVDPHEEDSWRRLRVGAMRFLVCKPCPRCVIPTIDPETFEKDKEPLATLATYRRSELGVIFGQNLVHEGLGELNLGDEVEVLEERDGADESA